MTPSATGLAADVADLAAVFGAAPAKASAIAVLAFGKRGPLNGCAGVQAMPATTSATEPFVSLPLTSPTEIFNIFAWRSSERYNVSSNELCLQLTWYSTHIAASPATGGLPSA